MEHHYDVTVRWTGNTGDGTTTYRGYRRTHTVTAQGPPVLLGSADRTFHGDRERWNPEQLLLASLAQCHMLSYLHACVTVGVVVTGYVDRATGAMRTETDGSGRFTEVVLHPEVTVADASMVEAATKAHHRAHELCFIANSVSFPVRHEPVVSFGGGTEEVADHGHVDARPIGRVESSLTELEDAPRQGDEGAPDAWLVLDPAVTEGLHGLEEGSDVVVLTWLDRADRDVLSVHPRGDTTRPVAGVFATRSPDRPNPIGLHRVTVLAVDGGRLHVSGIEAVDGTPVLDVKPVLGAVDER
jgi:tRNA-Thr(GGU) m(6)t(6)A37 methyltransferase TsaA